MNFAKVFDKSHHPEILVFEHKTWNLGNIYGKVSFNRVDTRTVDARTIDTKLSHDFRGMNDKKHGRGRNSKL